MILNNSDEKGYCPKCKSDLEFNGGFNMETGNYVLSNHVHAEKEDS